MKPWIMPALMAALAYGTYMIPLKAALAGRSGGTISTVPANVLAGISLGILAVSALFLAFARGSVPARIGTDPTSLGMGALAGSIWAVAIILVIHLLKDPNVSLSRVSPLFNANVLVPVLMGIFVFKEVPAGAAMVKVILGTFMILAGSYVVSS